VSSTNGEGGDANVHKVFLGDRKGILRVKGRKKGSTLPMRDSSTLTKKRERKIQVRLPEFRKRNRLV